MKNQFNHYLESIAEIGYVEQLKSSIAYVSGLPNIKPGEIVVFENNTIGQVLAINPSTTEILLFDKSPIKVGFKVARTNEFLEIDIKNEMLGKIVNALGKDFSANQTFTLDKGRSIDVGPLGINSRKKITKPLETGVTLVDLLVPIGKGQRELIVGDRKTGKSSFLRQTIHNLSKKDIICVYAAIGKKMTDIIDLKKDFDEHAQIENVVIVASNSQEPAGVIFLTPYTAMTIAEYFRDQGKDVLLVLDDLTTHAKFYREISLLAQRFPGRESYPGDIFYIHSKLLERAGNFHNDKSGEASITCLPVAESLEGDITGYIQTNLMSMADGHIFFDNELFVKGRRPSINPFLSVTRVGNQTQSQLRKDIRREIITVLNLFEKSENFVHFGSTLIENTKLSLATGERILQFFTQEPSQLIDANCQILLFTMLWLNLWKTNDYTQMKKDMESIILSYQTDKSLSTLVNQLINDAKSFNDFLSKISPHMDTLIKLIPTKNA